MDANQSVALSPTQATPPSSRQSGISSIPIRAPLSSDSDLESALKTHSRSSSDSDSIRSAQSFDSEEGFLSGEDGFETASERPSVHDPDEDNLELAMEREEIGLVVDKSVLGSSSLSTTPPKARISGETDDDDDDVVVASEAVDDGVETVARLPVAVGLVDAPEVGGLGVEEGEEGEPDLLENDLVSENSISESGSTEVNKKDILPENPKLGGLVESSENGVLDSEVNGSILDENPVLDSASAELAMDKEDNLPENLKVGAVENSENGVGEKVEGETKDEAAQETRREEEVGGIEDGVVDEKNSEALTIGTNQASPEDAVVIDSKLVEEDKEAKSASEGDLFVEARPVLLEPESGDVGDLEENPVSEVKPVEVEVNSPVSVAVDSDHPPAVIEESNDKEAEALIEESSGVHDVEENRTSEANPLEVEVNSAVISGQSPAAIEESDGKAIEAPIEEEEKEVKSTSEGDLLVEAKPVSLEPESDGVVDVEENPVSEVKPLDVEVNSPVSVAVLSDQPPGVIEESDDKEVEALTGESAGVHDVEENPTSEANPLKVEINSPVSLAVVSDQSPAVIEESDYKAIEAPIEESGGIHDIEENQTSEAKPLEVEVRSAVSVDAVSEQSPAVIEESGDLKVADAFGNTAKAVEENGELSASQKHLEPVDDSAIEMQEPVSEEPKIEVVEVQKDGDEKDSSGVALSPSVDPDNNSEKPELESEPQTDRGIKVNEPMFRLTVDEDENVSGDELDGLAEAQSANSSTKPEEMSIVQENNVPVLSTKSSDRLEDVVSNSPPPHESAVTSSIFGSQEKEEVPDEVNRFSDYEEEEAEGSVSEEDNEELNFGSSGTAEQIMKELMRGSGVSFNSGAESSQDNSQRIDGQIVMDSDEEVDTDEEGEGKELFDSAALAALLKAATSVDSERGNVTVTSQDGSRLFSVERPAGLGSSIRSSKPVSQPSRPNIFTSSDLTVGGESENLLSEEEKKKLEKLQLVRVKFLRLLHRLGHSPDDAIAAQVLYRMVLAAGRQTGQAFSLESAKKMAMRLEAEKSEDLDFSLNILVLGKTGVGKSATINSIFGEEKAKIGAFQPGTTTVKEIIGTVGGVKIRVFDTPGLMSSVMEQAFNRKILTSVKKLTKKFPLDILLYVDRLDTQTRDLNDLPMLRTITNTLGSSVWRSAVVTLTHAASAPPDGPSGSPLSYEVFVAQRSHIVQQSIGQAVGDLRMMNPSLMNPVALVENHPSCRKNREGQRILPNGQIWRPQLLLLCYSLKVLSEVSSLSKPQDPFDHRKLFGLRVRAPPLPYLLSSLLQSRAHPKLPDDQGGENVDSDIDLEDLSDSDQDEEEDEYDQLPPFKPLRKAQIAKLSKDQKKAYFDEYDYRVKLLQKKQWKEELKRMKEMKKGKNKTDSFDYMGEEADQEGPAAVPVPLPDMVLPPSFDGDSPAYRYRFLEPTSQLLARPVLDSHGWDHDCGYDGVSLEENLAIAGRFPGGVAVQITKDKKEFNIHLDSSIAAKHGENGSTLAGFDIQTIGKQLGYIVRGETKFKNLKKNKTTGGISVTFLGENVATGVKVEDQISIGKRLTLVGSTGTIRSQGDAAYGANMEVRLKEKDFPIGQDQSTLGLSLMKWRGDLALGANLQSQISIGRSSKMSLRVGLNNKLSGQITVRTSSSEQLQLALVGILPIAISIYRTIWPSAGETFSAY